MEKRNRATVVCVHDGHLLTFKGIDPLTKKEHLFPPGGKIEEGETPEQTAIRETLEETGYAIKLKKHRPLVSEYPFEWNGTLYQCHTTFFRAELVDPDAPRKEVQDAEYNMGVVWVPVERLRLEITYSYKILESIERLLDL